MMIRIDLFILIVTISILILGLLMAWIAEHNKYIIKLENAIERKIGVSLDNENN